MLGKKNTGKHEASILDLEINIKNGKFHCCLFVAFYFSIVKMPEMPSNVPSTIVYCAIGAKLFRIIRASNNPESFSTPIKLLILRISRQGVSIEKNEQFYPKHILNKYQLDFNMVCQSKPELLNLVS